MPKHCHKLVSDTAKGLAAALLERILADNVRYAEYKKICPELTPRRLELMLMGQLWPQLVEEARATLAALLATPIKEELKLEIQDALIQDNFLRQGRIRRRDQIIRMN